MILKMMRMTMLPKKIEDNRRRRMISNSFFLNLFGSFYFMLSGVHVLRWIWYLISFLLVYQNGFFFMTTFEGR